MARHPKIGDIIEINTANGKAYAFYTHKNAQFSYLIRVFRDLHAERPKSLEQVVNGAVAFSIFFPLATALNKGIFSVVGNQSVPAHLQPPRCFAIATQTSLVGKMIFGGFGTAKRNGRSEKSQRRYSRWITGQFVMTPGSLNWWKKDIGQKIGDGFSGQWSLLRWFDIRCCLSKSV